MVSKTKLQFILDTDISSYIIKNKPEQVKYKFSQYDTNALAISAITKAELLNGIKKFDSRHPITLAVQQYLRYIPVLDWSADSAIFYADIAHYLKSNGQPIGTMDMLIASHSMALNATLVTNNEKHYQRIIESGMDLKIENWVTQTLH